MKATVFDYRKSEYTIEYIKASATYEFFARERVEAMEESDDTVTRAVLDIYILLYGSVNEYHMASEKNVTRWEQTMQNALEESRMITGIVQDPP